MQWCRFHVLTPKKTARKRKTREHSWMKMKAKAGADSRTRRSLPLSPLSTCSPPLSPLLYMQSLTHTIHSLLLLPHELSWPPDSPRFSSSSSSPLLLLPLHPHSPPAPPISTSSTTPAPPSSSAAAKATPLRRLLPRRRRRTRRPSPATI